MSLKDPVRTDRAILYDIPEDRLVFDITYTQRHQHKPTVAKTVQSIISSGLMSSTVALCIPVKQEKNGKEEIFFAVVDGNHRACALRLLRSKVVRQRPRVGCAHRRAADRHFSLHAHALGPDVQHPVVNGLTTFRAEILHPKCRPVDAKIISGITNSANSASKPQSVPELILTLAAHGQEYRLASPTAPFMEVYSSAPKAGNAIHVKKAMLAVRFVESAHAERAAPTQSVYADTPLPRRTSADSAWYLNSRWPRDRPSTTGSRTWQRKRSSTWQMRRTPKGSAYVRSTTVLGASAKSSDPAGSD